MKIVAMFKRKAGLTPEQFREYYETRHSVLSLKIFPFLKDYRRNYIRHDMGPQSASGEPTTADLGFDVITEITFARKEDYQRMLDLLADPAIREQVVEDEKQFMDRSATLVYFGDEEQSQIPAAAAA